MLEDINRKGTTVVVVTHNKEIVNTIIMDIIKNSTDKPYIKLSDDILDAMIKLKQFNYKNIYYKANTKETLSYYEKIFTSLFEYYLNNIENDTCSINSVFLNSMNDEYLKNTSNERKVIDYLAGMTDDFIIREYESITK